jgi:3-oxoadipate enol-lactonase
VARVLTADGVGLNVEIAGPEGAPAILFAHSVGCDLHLWDSPFAALGETYRVIRFDTRGHGGSDAPEGDYAVEQLAEDALAVLDWAGVERAVLCGLSLGGTTAQWLALHRPERLTGIVLANTAARLGTVERWEGRIQDALTGGMEALADPSMERFFSQGFHEARPDVVAQFRAAFAATPAQGYAGCCAVLRDCDFREDLGRIALPCLVVAGEEDVGTPPSDAAVLAAGIPGARSVILPTGHLSAVEAPDLFSQALAGWLREAAPPA